MLTPYNFSIDVEEWMPTSSLTSFCVDVIDNIYTVSTSGTYFLIDDIPMVTTYSGITGGYRFCCIAPTISGSITVTIHSENDNYEVDEQEYNLLFGYHVEFNERIDWGPNQEVIIWSSVKNDVMCSNTEVVATYFKTKDLEYRNLGAYVYPTGRADLVANIVPQSKYLLPGYTYTITITGVKDYSGNNMEPLIFNFTVSS